MSVVKTACTVQEANEFCCLLRFISVSQNISSHDGVLCRQAGASAVTMATGDAVMTLLVMLAITSSVTGVHQQLQSADGVSHDAMHSGSQSVTEWARRWRRADDDDVMMRRTPGWGKRVAAWWSDAAAAASKRRGWGKRYTDNICDYWRSVLQLLEVGISVSCICELERISLSLDQSVLSDNLETYMQQDF